MTDEAIGRTASLLRTLRPEELVLSGSNGRLPIDSHPIVQSDVASDEKTPQEDRQQVASGHHQVQLSEPFAPEQHVVNASEKPDSLTNSLESARNAIRDSLDPHHLPTSGVPNRVVAEELSDHKATDSIAHAVPVSANAESISAAASGHEGFVDSLEPFQHVASETLNSTPHDAGGLLGAVDQTVHSTLENVGQTVDHVVDAVAGTLSDTVGVAAGATGSVLGMVADAVSNVGDAAVTVASLGGVGHDALSGLIQPVAPVAELASSAIATVDHVLLSLPIGVDQIHHPDIVTADMQHSAHAHIGTGLI